MIAVLIIGLILFMVFLWYMGIFHKVVIEEQVFRGGYYCYKNYQSHINNYPKTKQ